jgi:pyruvate/2-oxoglutarate dehydrogenase complex dihydrolipoamide dehydrogenase (E3) component/uncharacterized membrane protein YdjX (TVP38/TMEM64 family)
MSNTKRYQKLMVLAVFIAAVAAFFYFGLNQYFSFDYLKSQQTTLTAKVAENFWLAIIVFFVIYVVAAGLSLPGAGILTIAGGAIFGLVTGTVVVSFASSIGAYFAFLGARFLFRDAVTAKFGTRLTSLEKGIRKDGAFYLLSLRLVPAVPFFVVNLLMGLTSLKGRTFYGVSQLGMLPGTIAYVYVGTQLASINKPSDIISPGIISAFVVLGLLPITMRKLSNWLSTRRVYKGHKKPKKFDYNLIAIGAGSAGLVTTYIGSAVKAKVALIEKHKMGGDCLNTGCVPSKALIRSAKLLHEAKESQKYGITKLSAEFNFADVMERVQTVITKIEPHDSVERYSGLGVDCIEGAATIVSPWEVEVNGKRITTRSIVIATGARPLVPNIPGLNTVDYLTSDNVWNLRELPKRLVVLGGGPIGCELTQSFSRFGSQVTQVEMAPRLMPREDADAAAEVTQQFIKEGITVAVAHKALRVEKDVDGSGVLICEHEGKEVRFAFDKLLLALGRKANVEGFGLQELGVTIHQRGTVDANELLQTNFPNIYVCGDVTGPYQFTHVAAHQAWYASLNALLAPFWSFKVDYRVIPWATFTDPEVARVGLSEEEAKQQNIAVEVTHYGIDDLDRAIADSSDHGFVKVLTVPGKDKILGATIVGAHAGDLLAEFVLAMKWNIGLNKLLGTIHIYPTMAEANKYAAGNWKRAHAPQAALRFAEKFFTWLRG